MSHVRRALRRGHDLSNPCALLDKAVGTPGANQAPRNTDNDIWASDLHLTPNGPRKRQTRRELRHGSDGIRLAIIAPGCRLMEI